jgi:hypothetical protein
MPLAFPSHQGLVLPLWRRWPRHFDLLALCVGAAMPDVVDGAIGLARGRLGQSLGHSLAGLVALCLPGGLLVTWLARRVGRRVDRTGLPGRVLRALLRGVPRAWPPRPAKDLAAIGPSRFALTSLSLATGSLSHLGFDLASHGSFPWLAPWLDQARIFPAWWYRAWFQVPLPGYAEPYPFGPHAVVWCVLSLTGGVLFFVRPRRGAS